MGGFEDVQDKVGKGASVADDAVSGEAIENRAL